MFYTIMDSLCAVYDSIQKTHAFAALTREEHAAWKRSARARLTEISGLDLCRACAPNARLTGDADAGGLAGELWTIDTEPGVTMPFWRFAPDAPNGAAVILPHGHGGGKETCLWLKTGGEHVISLLTREGYTVFCPDARGSGDRREAKQQEGDLRANSHRAIMHMMIGFGGAPIGPMVWDLMRLLDHVEKQPGIDPARIACSGMSGGGQQTLWLAALDDRVRAAITSGYFYGVKESLLMLPDNCDCNFVPFFWRTMDMGDMGAMIAPRALHIESGRFDPLCGASGVENVYPQVETARRAYALFGAEDRLVHRVYEGKHEWFGHHALPFLRGQLGAR